MAFSAQDVKDLREKTGVGMMDCKKALTASDGDIEKAVEWLREKGLAAAEKKAGRIAAEGMAYATVIDGVGVAVEVNSESDFVAKNEKFTEYVSNVAAVVAKENPADVEALMACAYPGGGTVEQAQQEKVLVIGENIKVRRFARYATGLSVPYVHMGGRIGVIVNMEVSAGLEAKPEVLELGKDVAMQIAAMNPTYHGILARYHARTGIPSIINTSFNMHEEPIVCSPDDAVRAYVDAKVGVLSIGSFVVRAFETPERRPHARDTTNA